jgi:hypothetical protein
VKTFFSKKESKITFTDKKGENIQQQQTSLQVMLKVDRQAK